MGPYEDYLHTPVSAEDWLDLVMDSNLSPTANEVAVVIYDHAVWDRREHEYLHMRYDEVWRNLPDFTPRRFHDALKELRDAGLYRGRGHRLTIPGPNYWSIRYAMGYVSVIPEAVVRG